MFNFSTSAKNMRSSEIRKLMKLAADPSIISFAGGMPNNELFPVEAIEEVYNKLTLQEKQTAFQYCPTPGYPPLVETLKEYLRSRGLPVDTNELIITTGAQQAINILTKVFIDPGDTIITEYPSFIGALAAFKSYGANLHSVDLDDNGVIIDKLEEALKKTEAKMLYLCPYFHNPAGITYNHERKLAVIEMVKKYNIPLLEDDPYGELYFDEDGKKLITPMKSIADDSLPICYVGSFAKILGPGIRIGYLLGPPEIAEKCGLAKQSMDACTATYTQVLANAFLKNDKLKPYLEYLRPTYKRRADITLKALTEFMPEGITWTIPKGGFYIWVTMPEHINATDVFNKSLEQGAAFVSGSAFDPNGIKNNCFRLAYSHTKEEKLAEGIRMIGNAVKSCM